jgi:hypothetical protein
MFSFLIDDLTIIGLNYHTREGASSSQPHAADRSFRPSVLIAPALPDIIINHNPLQ